LNNYKLLGITLAILITSSIISAGFTNPAHAKSSKVRVDCTEVAITLISWDALYKYIDLDDLTAIEDAFGDDNEVNPASFDEIIDDHMEELLDDFEDANCDKSVDDDLVDWIDDNVDFERQD
jgi:hypothetical protein